MLRPKKPGCTWTLQGIRLWGVGLFQLLVWTGTALIGFGQSALPNDASGKAVAILKQYCWSCHGPEVQEADLRLDSREALQRTGASGVGLLPGQQGSGELLRRIFSHDPDIQMPPTDRSLSPDQKQVLKEWLEAGAGWPATVDDTPVWPDDRAEHWAWQPLGTFWEGLDVSQQGNLIDHVLQRPRVSSARANLNSIKQFETPSLVPAIGRIALIRRVYFDVTGLPPSPEEIGHFLADDRPEAYEELVDRLLESPRFGERWARHWLDAVHYADTHGYDKDQPRSHAWPYRDYVIRAFNENKPYARFIQEQIAGDILYPATRDGIEALGMAAAGPWDFIGHVEVPETKQDGKIARHLDRDDMLGTVLGTFCSITIQCAQCHDHKFDPITQREYYQLQSVFAAVDRTERKYYCDEGTARRAAKLDSQRSASQGPVEPFPVNGRWYMPTEPDWAASKVPGILRCQVEREWLSLPSPNLVYAIGVHQGTGNFSGTGGSGGRPRPIHLLARGNVALPGEEVGPAGVHAIRGLATDLRLEAEEPESARRAALALWISASQNPLTWRSFVNRVWQHYFGDGLVATANDFGRMGAEPVRLDLLDALAIWFRDQGGFPKQLHKLILMSEAYRQPAGIGFQTRKKLDAEAIRDSILVISGRMDWTMGGPGFQDFSILHPEHSPHYQYDQVDPGQPALCRRSIYRFVVRSQTQPMLAALDCADPSVRVGKRNETNTALQALTLLNDRFILTHCDETAERVRREVGEGVPDQIERLMQLTYGRSPDSQEGERLAEFVKNNSLAALVRVLVNSNEFLFVD